MTPSCRVISYFEHFVVAVLWCIDFGLSGMPLPAVHCFGSALMVGAYMFCSLLITDMRVSPPYFFMDARYPGNGVFVFGIWFVRHSPCWVA